MSEVEAYFCNIIWVLKHPFSFQLKIKLFVRTHLSRKLENLTIENKENKESIFR